MVYNEIYTGIVVGGTLALMNYLIGADFMIDLINYNTVFLVIIILIIISIIFFVYNSYRNKTKNIKKVVKNENLDIDEVYEELQILKASLEERSKNNG